MTMIKLRKLLCVALVAIMLVSVSGIPALAAGSSNEFGIEHYVALGDSFGAGLSEDEGGNVPKVSTGQDADGNDIMVEVFGSSSIGYNTQLAQMLNLSGAGRVDQNKPDDGYRSWAYCGMRTKDLLFLLDETTPHEDDTYFMWEGYYANYAQYRADVKEDLCNADLITLEIGGNDFFTAPLYVAIVELASESDSADTEEALIDAAEEAAQAAKGEDTENALTKITELLETMGLLTKFTTKFSALAMKGYAEMTSNYPKIIKLLREWNPEAQIVLQKIPDPYHSLSLTNNGLISIGQIIDSIVAPANAVVDAAALRYRCSTVDILDVELINNGHPSKAGYKAIADRTYEKLCPVCLFSDIADLSNEFKTAVFWAVQNGITNGKSETAFAPNDTCTRAEIVTFLWRMADKPAPTEAASFTDLTQDWYKDAVAWAAENGITNGTSADQFSPDQTCTRAQIVTFLYRYDQKFNPDAKDSVLGGTSFRDVSPLAYYGTPVAWAVKNGITKGTSAILFAPLAGCTRVQAVTFLYRYAQL